MSVSTAPDVVPLETWEGRELRVLAKEWGVPEVIAYARLGSTNDEARERAAAGAPAGFTVIADEQIAGRGRGGNTWSAEPDTSLLMSIVLRPAVISDSRTCFGTLPLRAGLAVASAVEEVAQVRAGFKWPNDLLVDGRKLAGILCEGALDAAGGFVVCGVGVNVKQRAGDFPAHLRGTAASLRTAGADDIDRGVLAGAIVRRITRAGLDHAPLSPQELDMLHGIDVLLGREVTIDGRLAGIAAGIADDGSLRLRNGADLRAVYSGTVRLTSSPQPQL